MTGPRVAKPYSPYGIRKRPELFFSPLSFKKHCLTSSFATERANHAGSVASLTYFLAFNWKRKSCAALLTDVRSSLPISVRRHALHH